jgi:glycerophosphoryl diester phosphodiesterase
MVRGILSSFCYENRGEAFPGFAFYFFPNFDALLPITAISVFIFYKTSMRLFFRHCLTTICLTSFQFINAQFADNIPKTAHHFIVVAHRGDHTHVPENTIAAFEAAVKEGADYAEIDLRTTLDSQLIIMHDASVDRMTDGRGLVKDMTLEEIRKLKVKDKIHPDWGEFDIPLFKEVLELCRGRINIYLDFKDASPAETYKEIRKYGMEKNVVVYLNREEQFYDWRKSAPAMPLMVSLPDEVKDTAGMKHFLQNIHVEILDGDFDKYSGEMLMFAAKSGYLVLPDIQGKNENPSLWDIAIQKGLKALQTDHPGELINYLQEQGIR